MNEWVRRSRFSGYSMDMGAIEGGYMEVSKKYKEELRLKDYVKKIKGTDRYQKNEILPALMGLYGEVGSLMTAAKKHSREGDAFIGYKNAVIEEFGDALWYFSAICDRLHVDIEEIFYEAVKPFDGKDAIAVGESPESPLISIKSISNGRSIDDVLLELGKKTHPLLSLKMGGAKNKLALKSFAFCYLVAMKESGVSFREVAEYNIAKTTGRFIRSDIKDLPKFDSSYNQDEIIPEKFDITVRPRSGGKICMTWRGVFVGDPLTDNIKDEDGYRFHDVFHFAHAAILHWSPTFRSLIKHKRKSNPDVDEQQDGGRAIVVEEGLTAWIFSCAKKLNFFEGANGVSFDMLKTIRQFVEGYEVEACPLSLWERAILDGYSVFREVKKNNGGIVVCDKKKRTIEYRAISEGSE